MNEINQNSSYSELLSFMNKLRTSGGLTREQDDQLWLVMAGLMLAGSVKRAENPTKFLKNLPESCDFKLVLFAAKRVLQDIQL